MNTVYYAEDGQYATLSGMPYVGPFHVMSSGILMTGAKHSMKSEVIVQTTNRTKDQTNIPTPQAPNTSLNENDTEYDLLPELINSPPIILKSIGEASTPQVKPSVAAGTLDGEYMYIFPDGNVKVHAGVSITMKIEAEQPPIFNVENGVLEVKDPQEGLSYRWFIDGEAIVGPDIDSSLRASRIIDGNTLTITNMIPRYAGVYTCVVSNDIGSTDGGSLSMEVYNSNVDSFFYTNLVTSPNGRDEEGALNLDGWESLAGNMVSKQFSKKTIGERDKSIVVDPMNQNFQWTKEMMFPRPYQLDGGVLQNNPLRNINTYITRDKYQYTLNGGSNLAQIYQDIDIEPLQDHVRGSIYGVDGITAIISFYIGNAIFNYESARPYLTPDTQADKNNYYLGAARLSLENFIKMGPGSIKEEVSVQIEEYENDTRLKSNNNARPITIRDPWNARMPNYANQVYYGGGVATIDGQPSGGGRPDQVLFVADELFPTQQSRYTYGQYAEFQKLVLPKLNPKTNKIRLIYTIQAKGELDFILNSNDNNIFNITDGVLSLVGWQGSFESGKLLANANAPNNDATDKPLKAITANYRTNTADFEQRIPKQSISRAFATGFNVTLIPTGPAQNNESAIQSIYNRNTKVEGLIPSPIPSDPRPFDPQDTGVRDVTITFLFNHDTNSIAIQMIGRAPSSPETTFEQVDYEAGLLPFERGSETSYIQPYSVVKSSQLIQNGQSRSNTRDVKASNGILTPPYLNSALEGENLVQLQNGNYTTQVGFAPSYPKTWYTIDNLDKLSIYKNTIDNEKQPLNEVYPYWALPSKPLDLQSYADSWNSSQKAFTTNAGQLQSTTTQWEGYSRFVITIGVHDTSFDSNDPSSLYAIDNYYLDFTEDSAVFHKQAYNDILLPSFDSRESLSQEEKETLNTNQDSDTGELKYNTSTKDIYKWSTAADVNMTPITAEVSKTVGSNDKIASFEIPITLLSNARSGGGLNIPILSESSQSLSNAVDGTVSFYKNTPPLSVPANIYNENLQSILSVLDAQIEVELENYNASQQTFFGRYTYTLPHNDPKQTEIVFEEQTITNSLGNEQTINLPIVRSAIPEDSVLMVLGRRKYILEETYNTLITQNETPEDSTLSARVLDESSIQPTEALIYLTFGGELDPKYKVVLYGMRPAPITPTLQDSNKFTGTPLSGVVEDKVFTVKNIEVMNTGSL
jgi:hypothetical protein